MSAIKTLNPQAEVARAHAALQININAALGLQEVLRTNLGPKGTIKMYACRPSYRTATALIDAISEIGVALAGSADSLLDL